MIAGAGQGKHLKLDIKSMDWSGSVTSETSTETCHHQGEKKKGARIWQKWRVESDKVSWILSCLISLQMIHDLTCDLLMTFFKYRNEM